MKPPGERDHDNQTTGQVSVEVNKLDLLWSKTNAPHYTDILLRSQFMLSSFLFYFENVALVLHLAFEFLSPVLFHSFRHLSLSLLTPPVPCSVISVSVYSLHRPSWMNCSIFRVLSFLCVVSFPVCDVPFLFPTFPVFTLCSQPASSPVCPQVSPRASLLVCF